jgi:hypothetical protein
VLAGRNVNAGEDLSGIGGRKRCNGAKTGFRGLFRRSAVKKEEKAVAII